MEHKILAHGCGGQCSGNCGEGKCEGCGCETAGTPDQEIKETE